MSPDELQTRVDDCLCEIDAALAGLWETSVPVKFGPFTIDWHRDSDGRTVARLLAVGRDVQMSVSPQGKRSRVWVDGLEVTDSV